MKKNIIRVINRDLNKITRLQQQKKAESDLESLWHLFKIKLYHF